MDPVDKRAQIGRITLKKIRFGLMYIIILLLLFGGGQGRLLVYAGETIERTIGGTVEEGEKAYIFVDSNHAYEGMNAAFSKGYLPTVQEGKVHITVPFVVSGEMKGNAVAVSVDLGDSTSAPFVFKNYEKKIDKKVYTFESEEIAVYLFQCEIDLLENPAGGQYPVILRALGYDTGGKEVTMSCTVYVKVEGSDPVNETENDGATGADPGEEAADSVGEVTSAGSTAGQDEILHGPRFMISSDNVSGTRIQAGEEPLLEAEFVNKSSNYTVYNLKVTVSSNDENLLLKSGSYYEASISPGGSFTVSDEIDIALNTEQGTKILTYQFVYEDKNGTSYTDTLEIRFVVYQSVKAKLKGFELAETVTATETLLVDMQLANESRAPVYNVEVSLAGEGLKPAGDIFLGNIEAGSAVEGSMKLYISGLGEGDSYGATKGIITVRYEDAYGTAYEETYDCSTNIQEPQIVTFQMEEEVQETNQWWISIIVVVIMLLITVNVLLFFKVRHLAKEGKVYESPDAE